MPRHVEPFSGGLVTSRDPYMLALGEMSVMQNAVYYPGNLAPQRASGRAVFGTVAATATPVRGLRDLKFDNGDHFLLGMQGTTLSSAAVGDTGTFASCTNYAVSGSALDAVQFNNEWFLFGGTTYLNVASASGNLVAYTSATSGSQPLKFRSHGIVPNMDQPQVATGAGTWTAGSTGYFEYWFTEVFEYVHDGITSRIEGTYGAPKPYTLFVSSTAMQASITIPGSPTHTDATKWILYRSPVKALESDTQYPTGFYLAEGTFGTNTVVVDGGATEGAYVSSSATGNSGYTSMTNPTNIFSSNDARAEHTGVALGGVAAAFATFAITNPVVGIKVAIEGRRSTALCKVSVAVSNDSGVTWSSNKVCNLAVGSTDSIVELGGLGDLWGLPWSDAELVSGKFLVRCVASAPLSATVGIDHIRAKVFSNGSVAQDESRPYPAIIISAAGVDAAVGSHGQPPPATTADIFQGSLVTNSRRVATNGAIERSFIRYSLPDQPDYFPDPYYLAFETPDNDEVTNLKTLNNRLGVFLGTRFYRINYLPSEADADFNRGICREEVSSQYGCVNAMCAAVYSGQGGRSEIAFVSNVGIHSTNLFSVRDLTEAIQWRQIIGTSGSTPIALINNPETSELLFFYKNSTSGSEHYKCLHLSYDGMHMRNGQLKISGPVHMRNHSGGVFADLYSAWCVQRSNGDTSTYFGYGSESASAATAVGAGKVYIEQGTSIPALDSTMKLRTRRLFLGNNLGSEFRLDRIFTYVASGSGSQSISITPYNIRTNDNAGVTTQTARSFSWSGAPLFHLDTPEDCEGLELEIAQASNNAGHFAPQMFMIEYTGQGPQDSGK